MGLVSWEFYFLDVILFIYLFILFYFYFNYLEILSSIILIYFCYFKCHFGLHLTGQYINIYQGSITLFGSMQQLNNNKEKNNQKVKNKSMYLDLGSWANLLNALQLALNSFFNF